MSNVSYIVANSFIILVHYEVMKVELTWEHQHLRDESKKKIVVYGNEVEKKLAKAWVSNKESVISRKLRRKRVWFTVSQGYRGCMR